ncbi:hypothetical protein RJ641_031477, partial [Dillenia turbinata]
MHGTILSFGSRKTSQVYEATSYYVDDNNLIDIVEFAVGNPCQVIRKYNNIDFLVIDHKFYDHIKLLNTIDVKAIEHYYVNPRGSCCCLITLCLEVMWFELKQVVGRKERIKLFTLPIREDMGQGHGHLLNYYT